LGIGLASAEMQHLHLSSWIFIWRWYSYSSQAFKALMSVITVTLWNDFEIITQDKTGDVFHTPAVLELLLSFPLWRRSG